MRPIGFSTGSLARGDFRRALALSRDTTARAIELSALRAPELEPLLAAIHELDLEQYRHISFHAPGSYASQEEGRIVDLLAPVVERGWSIVLHPDAVSSFAPWRALGTALLIENMDKRKETGRTAVELSRIFDLVPEAGFCFDIGHVRQVDPSMTEAYLILREHGDRLRQIHISEVSTASAHARISTAAARDFREVAYLIPSDTPAILETPVDSNTAELEMRRAADALSTEPIPKIRTA